MSRKRHCPRCDKDKGIKEFGRDKYRRDGVNTYCKECRRKITKMTQDRYAKKNEAKR